MKEMLCCFSRSYEVKGPSTTEEVQLENMNTGINTGTEPNGASAVTGL